MSYKTPLEKCIILIRTIGAIIHYYICQKTINRAKGKVKLHLTYLHNTLAKM